jgi:hypothetical protein
MAITLKPSGTYLLGNRKLRSALRTELEEAIGCESANYIFLQQAS